MFRSLYKTVAGLSFLLVAVSGFNALAADVDKAAIKKLMLGEHRSEKNTARNAYRHPVETLKFFGITPDMSVVEIWPGGGWYLEILAPYLREKGKYTAAGFEKDSDVGYYTRGVKKLQEKLAANPKLYNKVVVTEFRAPTKVEIAPAGSADAVLTFRNVHNWMRVEGQAESGFQAFYTALKPGGILGVVEHRGNPKVAQDPKAKSGYVNQDYVIALAEAAGFKLAAQSEINANPKDTKDHPHGVWTLPPSLRKHVDDKKYKAIGESDRMTLKFIKPVK